MLEIKNLTKSYDGKTNAVSDLTLTINDGEIFGFIGHNGAGKTTTIKCVVGILAFEARDVLIDGKSIKEYPIECKKVIAYIPDNPDLYEQLTAIQYLNFISDIYEINKEERKELILKYAKVFKLEDNLNDLVSSLSHGMKQKLALISAFIRKPKLLILDEPFVGLDPKASHDVKELMKELCASGSSIFFSTHVLEVAEKLCDRVGIIKNGELITLGTVEEVKGDKSLEDVFLEQVDE